jgi:Tol biopolymer transport system component
MKRIPCEQKSYWSVTLVLLVVASGCGSDVVYAGDLTGGEETPQPEAPLAPGTMDPELTGNGDEGGDTGPIDLLGGSGAPTAYNPNVSPGASDACTIEQLSQYGILFDSDAGRLERRVYAMRADGAALQALTAPATLAQEPALSPDGTRLAYATPVGIELLELATRRVEPGFPGGRQPLWTPDGAFLQFLVANIHSAETWIGQPGVEGIYSVLGNSFEYTPDGAAIVFSKEDATYDSFGIFEWNIERWEERPLTTPSARRVTQPSSSPDGVWIVAAMQCGLAEMLSLWVTPYALLTPPCEGRPITARDSFNAANPAWGPGTLIAYERGEIPRDIAIVDANSGDECVIANPGDDRNPRWFSVPTEPPR